MKIHFKYNYGDPMFVVEAETEQDKEILTLFQNQGDYRGKKFVTHSCSFSDSKVISFCFGWTNNEIK